MDALSITDEQVVARCAAIARLQAVADDMAWFVDRLGRSGEQAGMVHDRIAQGPLALRARAGWMLTQVALIQADAGMMSSHIIDGIHQRDLDIETPALRRLALSTLEATERRLQRAEPQPFEPAMREASR